MTTQDIISENINTCLLQWKFRKQKLWSTVCTPTEMGGCSDIYLEIPNNSQANMLLEKQPDPTWQCMRKSNRWRKEVRESCSSGKWGNCSSAGKSWPSAPSPPHNCLFKGSLSSFQNRTFLNTIKQWKTVEALRCLLGNSSKVREVLG